MYTHYRDKLMTKPVPYARVVKSMLHLLSRTSAEVPGANPEGFVEGRFIAQLESAGFFDKMNRLYRK